MDLTGISKLVVMGTSIARLLLACFPVMYLKYIP